MFKWLYLGLKELILLNARFLQLFYIINKAIQLRIHFRLA
ncbi:hypothetical protein PALI_a3139 [Pseudoalteromonas aliena SW19]|uniref:Uncharacterized protein n=1 Tax=Pseudoalteromonas aliena SW19 TaxID=1314866 RepID=A0ABR9E6L8_9GAMM|nr:hypothetical protein [Pseudoalteromonas aliena SW19]